MQVMHHLSPPAPGLLLHFTRLLPLLLADCPVTLGLRTPAEAQVSVVMSTRDTNIISIGTADGVAVVILSVVVVAPAEVCTGRAVAVAKVHLAAVAAAADAEVSAGVAVAQAEAAAVAAVAGGHRARCRG